jgi:hypothetical protein
MGAPERGAAADDGGDAPEQRRAGGGPRSAGAGGGESDPGSEGSGVDYAWLADQLAQLGMRLGDARVEDEVEEDEVRRRRGFGGGGHRRAGSGGAGRRRRGASAKWQRRVDATRPSVLRAPRPQLDDWHDPTGGVLLRMLGACEAGDAAALPPLLEQMADGGHSIDTPGPDGDTAL